MSFLPMHLLWQISESRSTGRLLCPDFFLYRDFTRFQGSLHPSDGMFYLIFWSFVAFTLAKLHLPWQVTGIFLFTCQFNFSGTPFFQATLLYHPMIFVSVTMMRMKSWLRSPTH
jgi:hypothetical protein